MSVEMAKALDGLWKFQEEWRNHVPTFGNFLRAALPAANYSPNRKAPDPC